ncbi:MAG: serine/threonine-protein kinase [Bacteroidota bacterium]
MSKSRAAQVDALFEAALDLPEAERAAYLDAHAPDAGLREEVATLLRLHAAADVFIDEAQADVVMPFLAEVKPRLAPVQSGDRIGPYQLTERLGEGGMGLVYRAQRVDGQFEQQVAIKFMQRGLASEMAIRRFQHEQQVLARLNHPNIARLYDGGVTPAGVPFLVMEYVQGEPIDTYCDGRQLRLDQRLTLFLQVAEAVQYAHRNLIVHRDLKPGNILVTPDGTPKLLDFGIAKLLSDEGGPHLAPLTRTGFRVMTPEYASPEQILGDTITTTSDVYQLGVLLYELLTGRRPYRIDSRVRHEIEQVVLNAAPTRPSTALVKVADAEASTAITQARRLRPDQLRRRLAGDLDMIVLMALRKEPERRYASVDALAEDLQRHLDGLPVQARPDTFGYRATRFVRRHRPELGAALVLVLLVIGYAATVTVQSARIAAERDQADAVTEFLIHLFEGTDPTLTNGDTLTALALLQTGTDRLDQLAGQPATRARLDEALARIYMHMGRFNEADSLIQAALAYYGAAGSPDADLARSLQYAADVHTWLGRYDSARVDYERSLALRQSLPPAHPDVLATRQGLSTAIMRLGDYPAALELRLELDALLKAAYGPDAFATARNQGELATVYEYMGDYATSDSLHVQSLRVLRDSLGLEHPMVVMNTRDRARTLMHQGRFAEAIPLLEYVARLNEQHYGTQHPTVPNTFGDLAEALMGVGRHAEAEPYARRSVELMRELYGDHQYIGSNLIGLGLAVAGQDRHAEAEAYFRDAVATYRRTLPSGHAFLGTGYSHMARNLHNQGRLDSAIVYNRLALDVYANQYGAAHPYYYIVGLRLADLLRDNSAWEEATAWYIRLHTLRRAQYADTTAALVALRADIADLYQRRGLPDSAAVYTQWLADA